VLEMQKRIFHQVPLFVEIAVIEQFSKEVSRNDPRDLGLGQGARKEQVH
jgi:hypothetical protein